MMLLPGMSSAVSERSLRASNLSGTSSKCDWPSFPVKMRRIAMAASLHAHVADESLPRVPAPLTYEGLLGRQHIGPAARIEAVGVGPALVHPPPRIGPAVVHLAAEQVASHAPHVLVLAEALEVLVILEHRVHVRHLERHVVEPRALVAHAEERVVIDVLLAAVAAVEGADEVVLVARVHVVGADEAERLAEPRRGLAHPRRAEHAVAHALDRRRRFAQPHQ